MNVFRKIYRHVFWPSPRICLLDLLPPNSVCAEIGVFKGDFSELILKKTKPEKLHLIDPWINQIDEDYKDAWFGGSNTSQSEMDEICEQVKKRFHGEINTGKVVVNRGMSIDELSQFADESLDWVYIDGNHLYEFVMNDLVSCYKKVKNGGYISGDDYNVCGWWNDGVTKAVNEFLLSHQCKLIMINDTQFLMQKIE